ncbi:tetratricopeptide repeat protein [Amycolatopsis sp. QT-25]|uniref:SEL1-like repeat protein n=1 Tax=Amycolatopsis sp. QT-25 TaxID=3034022 RepID=UPI0023EBCDEA|nr:tetratricopeptide repeat protein [Amycolatopsis sp. QT-25]WET78992.1 tetratricopeptide repeat protein [Amycolatopsis sp. QT-25]
MVGRIRILPRRRRPGDAAARDAQPQQTEDSVPAAPSLWDDYLARPPAPADDETRWLGEAEDGDTDAMFALSQLYETDGRAADAATWRHRAATAGHPAAMAAEAYLHDQRGSTGEARFWWRQAAEHGDLHARYSLALLLERDGETDEAETWYLAAAQDDHVLAQAQLAYLLHQRGDEQDADYWWHRAAEHDHLTALYNLGARALEDNRPRDAETWWHRAADLGHLDSTLRLASLLAGEQDERAEHWWERIADHHPYAARQAAVTRKRKRRRGIAEDQDLSPAARTWKLQARHGDTDAMFQLALYYQENRQPEHANTWLLSALHAGSTAVLAYLDYVHDRAEHIMTGRPPPCEHVEQTRTQRNHQPSTDILTTRTAEIMIHCRIQCETRSPYLSH